MLRSITTRPFPNRTLGERPFAIYEHRRSQISVAGYYCQQDLNTPVATQHEASDIVLVHVLHHFIFNFGEVGRQPQSDLMPRAGGLTRLQYSSPI
jgi:hypothetical protein